METTWQRDWRASKEYPILTDDLKTDVCIVGGGITGITLAYLLARAGKRVVVLEAGELRESSYTAYTTAMIMAQIDTAFPDLVRMFGQATATQIWREGFGAIDAIEEIIKKENIACEFGRTEAYVYGNNQKEWAKLEEEAKLLKEKGFPVSVPKEKIEIPNAGYYLLENQAKFHPLKYCDGLRLAAEREGAMFFEKTRAKEIVGKVPVEILTKNGKVIAEDVVVATYQPFHNPPELFARKGMYVSYMCELSIPKGILPEGLYLDGANPYHYFRVDRERMEDRLIIGGADHRQEIKMNPEKNFAEILDYAEKVLKGAKYTLITKWDGGILEPVDGLPFIGPYTTTYPNRYVATAYSGNGMTYSMIAAQIITNYIFKKEVTVNPFYPRRRLSLRNLWIKGGHYLMEFFGGALRNVFRKP